MAGRPTVATTFQAVDRMSKPMKRMQNRVTGFGRSTQRSFQGIGASLSRLRGLMMGAGAALAGGAVARSITSFAEAGDEIAKTSRQLGLGVEALQELRFAADRQGVSTENLEKSFKAMNNRLGLLRSGQGQLSTLLEKTNPQLREQLVNTTDSEEAFMLLMEAIDGAGSAAEKTALAQAAFSSSGRELVRVAEAGRGGIERLRQEAQDYGNIIDKDAATQSEKFNDSLTNLKNAFNGLRNNALTPLIRQLTPYLSNMAEAISKNRELITTRISDFFSSLKTNVKLVIDTVKALLPVAKDLAIMFVAWKGLILANTTRLIALNAVMAVKKFMQFTRVIGQIIRLKKGWAAIQGVLNVVLAANPIGAIIMGITALIGVVVLAVRHWGRLKEAVSNVWEMITNLLSPLKKVGQAFRRFFGGANQAQQSAETAQGGNSNRQASLGVSQFNRQVTENRSTVDLNIGQLPAGSTVRQRGQAPGFTLNYGAEGASL